MSRVIFLSVNIHIRTTSTFPKTTLHTQMSMFHLLRLRRTDGIGICTACHKDRKWYGQTGRQSAKMDGPTELLHVSVAYSALMKGKQSDNSIDCFHYFCIEIVFVIRTNRENVVKVLQSIEWNFKYCNYTRAWK